MPRRYVGQASEEEPSNQTLERPSLASDNEEFKAESSDSNKDYQH